MTTKKQKLGTVNGGAAECWFCQQRILARALFCHNCGCLQPPHAIDHFARFGLLPGFDIDMGTLEKQFEAFRKTLTSPRLVGRGRTEKQYIQRHLDAFTNAIDVLRNPISRARYILELNGIACKAGEDAETRKLKAGLQATNDIDALLNRALLLIEKSLYELASALRKDKYEQAAAILNRLEEAEKIVAEARQRRLSITDK